MFTERPPAFGLLLRRLRHAAGLTQEGLAERSGLSVASIGGMERGLGHVPRADTLDLLADALGLSPAKRAGFVAQARPHAAPAAPAGHNLHPPPTSLVGREAEQRAVLALLATHRLLTLTGSGGVGKTRLALAVAERLVERYPDGVWLVELAALGRAEAADQAPVLRAVAAVLGLREEPGRGLAQTLREFLAARDLLLVLDNCEHLVAACAAAASALLRDCPRLRILATSREPLGAAGEALYRVPSLMVSPADAPAQALEHYEAAALFLARARARLPGFAPEATTASAVARICAWLDGIPLAIELAAARVGALPVEAIADRLDDSFRLLSAGPRTALPRQRTLRASLEWSYALLSEPERSALRRLAVFAGGWELGAAEAVCAGEGIAGDEVMDLLASLVDKSLVLLEAAGLGGERSRYRLLETVRQYAGEQLAQIGEQAMLRDRLLAWCVALAEGAEPELSGPGQRRWLECLAVEHDNLRAALGWATSGGGTAELGMRLAAACWRFWYIQGHLKEGRSWLEHALRQGGAPAALRARVLNGAAGLAHAEGDNERAWALYTESLALRRTLGDEKGVASSLTNLGMVARVRGDNERARALYAQSLGLRRALGDSKGIANTLVSLGILAGEQGDCARATELLEEGLALFRAQGDRHGIALALGSLGNVALAECDYGRAQALHKEALALRQALGAGPHLANSLSNLGTVAADQGDYARAAALLEECVTLCRALGEKRLLAWALSTLGTMAADQGDNARAEALLVESLTLFRSVGEKLGMAQSLETLGKVRGTQGTAGRLLGAAAALRAESGTPLPPRLRARYDRAVAAARAALGEAAFAAGWAEGQAMVLEWTSVEALAPEADATPVR